MDCAVVVSVFFSVLMYKRHENREAATDTSHQNASSHVTTPALPAAVQTRQTAVRRGYMNSPALHSNRGSYRYTRFVTIGPLARVKL